MAVPAAGQKSSGKHVPRSNLLTVTPSSSLSVSVISLNHGVPLAGGTGSAAIDLGAVSYGGSHAAGVTIEQHTRSFTASFEFGLLISDRSYQSHFATVKAYISGPPTPLIYRIDGKVLGNMPVVVAGQSQVGRMSQHRLDVEVPNSVTERNAQQQAAVQFEVMAN